MPLDGLYWIGAGEPLGYNTDMTRDPEPPRRVAIVTHPKLPDADALAGRIATSLEGQGLTCAVAELHDARIQEQLGQGAYDLLIALGGDGTMLRAGQITAARGVPVLGINLGGFGFLTALQQGQWQPMLRRVVEGDFWLEERMMLHAEHTRDGVELGSWEVVNECVVGRGGIVRPVRLITEVDDHYLTTYVADAVIVATPTGSTAYALAAGGPILPPELRNILIVPVAPHLSVDRAIVLHEGSWVRVTVRSDHEASLTLDGQPSVEMLDGDQVVVSAGKDVVLFVRFQTPDYFYRNLTSRMNQHPSAGRQG
jgi:NAD+ kinase